MGIFMKELYKFLNFRQKISLLGIAWSWKWSENEIVEKNARYLQTEVKKPQILVMRMIRFQIKSNR